MPNYNVCTAKKVKYPIIQCLQRSTRGVAWSFLVKPSVTKMMNDRIGRHVKMSVAILKVKKLRISGGLKTSSPELASSVLVHKVLKLLLVQMSLFP